MIITENAESNHFFKSYVDYSMIKAQEGLFTLESYSPTVASFVEVAVTKVQELTPNLIEDLTVDGIAYLDELLETALLRTKELKGKLTADDVVNIIEQLKTEAGSQVSGLTGFLPSSRIQDFDVKERANEIMSKVLSQPQIIRDKATNLAQEVHNTLDQDEDGIVTVKDLAGNVAGVTQCATGYVYAALDTVGNSILSNLPKDALSSSKFEDYVLPCIHPYLESAKEQWDRKEKFLYMLLPLFGALEVVQSYVSLYAENVKNKFEPLSPYLMQLLGSTSVIDLPMEIMQILQTATGLTSDKERDCVVKETRALFWALIDISFLLEILKQEKNDVKTAKHNMEGIDLVQDAQALQDIAAWAGSFSDMKFS